MRGFQKYERKLNSQICGKKEYMKFNTSFITKFLNAILKMLDPIGIVAFILLRRVQHFIGAKFTFTLSVLKNFMVPL